MKIINLWLYLSTKSAIIQLDIINGCYNNGKSTAIFVHSADIGKKNTLSSNFDTPKCNEYWWYDNYTPNTISTSVNNCI